MNIIVAEVEKRAKEAAQQLRDAGRSAIVEYAIKAQREHEAAGMRYAHAALKAVEIMENAINRSESKTTYQPNESPEAKAQQAAEDARMQQRERDIRDHLNLNKDEHLTMTQLARDIRWEFADEYEARSWGMVQVGGYIGYTDFKTGEFVAYEPNNDQGVEEMQVEENTNDTFKLEPMVINIDPNDTRERDAAGMLITDTDWNISENLTVLKHATKRASSQRQLFPSGPQALTNDSCEFAYKTWAFYASDIPRNGRTAAKFFKQHKYELQDMALKAVQFCNVDYTTFVAFVTENFDKHMSSVFVEDAVKPSKPPKAEDVPTVEDQYNNGVMGAVDFIETNTRDTDEAMMQNIADEIVTASVAKCKAITKTLKAYFDGYIHELSVQYDALQVEANKRAVEDAQAVSEADNASDDTTDDNPLMKFQTIDAEQRTIKVTTHFVEVLTGPNRSPLLSRYSAEDVLNVRRGIDQNGSWVELKIKYHGTYSRRDSYPVGIDFNSTLDAEAFHKAVTELIEWGQTKTAPTKPDSAYKVTIGGTLYDTYPTHEAALNAAEPLRIHHTRRVEVVPV